MMVLLVRNKVKDYDQWKPVFDSQADAGRAAGLNLIQMWRSVDDANEIFFLLEVKDRGSAEAFMNTPEAEAVGIESGVIDGEFYFLNVEKVN